MTARPPCFYSWNVLCKPATHRNRTDALPLPSSSSRVPCSPPLTRMPRLCSPIALCHADRPCPRLPSLVKTYLLPLLTKPSGEGVYGLPEFLQFCLVLLEELRRV